MNICPLDEHNVAFYVLDVSGHGVAASLLAMTAAQGPFAAAGPDSLLTRHRRRHGTLRTDAAGTSGRSAEPEIRLGFANPAVPHDFLCDADAETRLLTYVSAGHPGAIMVEPGQPALILDQGCLPIGIGTDYQEHTVALNSGSRVYLYSDGVTEAMDRGRSFRPGKAHRDAGEPGQHSVASVGGKTGGKGPPMARRHGDSR